MNEEEMLTPRPVRDSQSEMTEIVLPNDANPLAALLGGRLMHWIDLAGAMAAHRHSRSHVVTASVDHIDFLVPVRVGDLVILRSSVNRVFQTSMEVGVKVFVENYIADTSQHVASAIQPRFSSSRHGTSYFFGPIRLNTSPSRPSSRTRVAVRPSRRRAWIWAVTRNTGAGSKCTSS